MLNMAKEQGSRIFALSFESEFGMLVAKVGCDRQSIDSAGARSGEIAMAPAAVGVRDIEQIMIFAKVFLMASTAAFAGQNLRFGPACVVFSDLVACTVARVLVSLNIVHVVTPKSIEANRLIGEMAFLAARLGKMSVRLGQLTCTDLSLARNRE